MNAATLCPKCGAEWLMKSPQPEGRLLRCPACGYAFTLSSSPEATTKMQLPVFAEGRPAAAPLELEDESALGEMELSSSQLITLEALSGPQKGQKAEVTKTPLTLGRSFGDVGLADGKISRIHASLEVYGERAVVLRDIASTNGTFVNGKLISSARLQDGDTIRVGSMVLMLRVRPKAS
jgi:pSer/pThr/pTyr-binding forkhead associated (FHA) protein